ncbi:1,4-benzoquinone reductase [Clavulina sp. PMI_390]|nr:1,4-benzoquinone reductase [Clavulina sp. PMI_390]
MAPKIAIVIYTLYGHIAKLAEAEAAAIKAAGGEVTIFQVPETLPEEVLTKMHAPAKPSYPIITPAELANFDGFLFGFATRYAGLPAQMKSFWDATGQLWAAGALHGKYAGMFVSTGGLGGGQEAAFFAALSTLVHHGLIFVPLGYKNAFSQLSNVEEVHGGSPFGAGTIAGPSGARQPSELELEVATAQGKSFYETVAAVHKSA